MWIGNWDWPDDLSSVVLADDYLSSVGGLGSGRRWVLDWTNPDIHPPPSNECSDHQYFGLHFNTTVKHQMAKGYMEMYHVEHSIFRNHGVGTYGDS